MAASGSAAPGRSRSGADTVYEAAFDRLPDPAALVDHDGRIMAANAAFSMMFGAAAGLAGATIAGLFADELDRLAAPWRRSGSRPYGAELKDPDGVAFRGLIEARDLTGGRWVVIIRRDAQAHLRSAANLARLAEAFATPRAGAFGMDLVTGEGQVSSFLAGVLGLPDGESHISLALWLDRIGPQGQAAVKDALAAASGVLFEPIRFTVAVTDASTGRSRRLLHDLNIAALNAAGRPSRLTGAVSDVSELAAAVDARADAERQLASLAQAAGASAWRFNLDEGQGTIEGPFRDALGGPVFSWPRWAGRMSEDDARRLHAALCTAGYGGRIDLTLTLNRGLVCRVRGERQSSGEIAGFLLAEPASPSSTPDSREAAASTEMSAWALETRTGALRLTGPVLGLLGLPGPEHVMDIAAWRARVPEADHLHMDRATQALEEDGVADVEYRVRAEDGRIVLLSLRGGVSEQDASGRPLRYSGFLSEISVRRRLERQIAERERQLADAVDAGLVGIWTYDYATRTQTARGRILDWMGKSRDADSVDGADWMGVIHPDDQPALRQAFAAMQDGQAVERLDVRLKSPEGWRWGRTHGAPLDPGPDGRPRRAAGVIVDIHAERAFRKALEAEKARFETVYRQTPALLHSIDPQGMTLSVSDYWLKRMGYPRDAVIGAPGWSFVDEETAERLKIRVIPAVLERGAVENEPITAFTASGEALELRLSAFLETDRDGRPIAAHGVLSDVTDLQHARRELEDHAAALERTNRELDRFATVASHDLQEPLRKISAFASLLERRLSGEIDSESQQALDFMVDAAGRMRTLLDDLLAYSRASNRALDLKPVALGPCMKRVLATLDIQIIEAQAAIRVGELPDVIGDDVLLNLLFQNLIANALKYRTESSAEVRIEGRLRQDGFVAIDIADNGIGFDMAFAQKIFEPFARLHTREDYSGTGIGLAICQQAAERMGGRITVRSTPGEGAVFTVELPAAPFEAPPQVSEP